jgi:hypothetical protein
MTLTTPREVSASVKMWARPECAFVLAPEEGVDELSCSQALGL